MARIAIIGSGISGMSAAYLLHRAGHAITLYEKNAAIGGHTRTVTIDYDGVSVPVDTGFIVFNEPNYPHLNGMFRHLNVPVQKSDMSFAVTVEGGRFEWGARNLKAVFGQRRNLVRPSFWRLIRDVMQFNAKAEAFVEGYPGLTLASMVKRMGLGKDFLRHYILPMGGAIWSCPPSAMLEFPASTFVRFFKNHALLDIRNQHQWYTVVGGAQEYVWRLTESYRDKIRTNSAIVHVTRENGNVQIFTENGQREEFDQVIFASHADEALALLKDPTEEERQVLGAFHYQKNRAYLHRDVSQMPRRKACWASWVYQAEQAGDEMAIGITYCMNMLQSIDERMPLFVTLNPNRPIDPSLVFNVHDFTHPVFTCNAIAAQARLPTLQGVKNSWFCGAYTRYGFHEDGIASAVGVAQALGAEIPWH